MEMLYTLNSMFNFRKKSLLLLFTSLIASSCICAQEDSYYQNYYEEEVPLIDSDKLLELMTDQLIEQHIRHGNALISWEINMPEMDVWMKESEYLELLKQWKSNQPNVPKTRFKLNVDIPIGCKKRISAACYDVEEEAIVIDHEYSERHPETGKKIVTELSSFDSSLSNEGKLLVEHSTQNFALPRDTMRENQQDIKLYAVVSNGVYRDEMADYSQDYAWIEVEDWILKIKNEIVSFKVSVDLVPLFKVQPVYPRRAQQRGTEGYVIVAFTVNESGSIEDPYVVEGKCRSSRNRDGDYNDCTMFNSATLAASQKLKYKPVIRNGIPIVIEDVVHKYSYYLSD